MLKKPQAETNQISEFRRELNRIEQAYIVIVQSRYNENVGKQELYEDMIKIGNNTKMC